MKAKKLAVAVALGVTLLAAAAVQAHGIWFAQRATHLALQYGIGADDLDMVKRASYVTTVTAYGADGKEVPTSLNIDGRLLLANTEHQPSVLAAAIDNGMWSKTPDGKWYRKGKDEVPGTVFSQRTFKYTVHIRGPLAAPIGPLAGQTLQVVPVSATVPSLLGQPITLRVLYKGKPLAGAKIMHDFLNDPDGAPVLTGADGTVTLKVRNQGLNVIAAVFESDSDQPAKYDRIEHTATLSFVLPHLPE